MGSPHVKALRVTIVSRSRFAREGIARLLNQNEQLDVCSHHDSLEFALPAIVEHAPNVVVIDVSDAGDIDSIGAIRAVNRKITVVVSGLDGDDQRIVSCARAGAGGYIREQASGDDWAIAIRAATKGEIADTTIGGILNRYVADTAGNFTSPQNPATHPESWRAPPEVEMSAARVGLTKRERQILALVDKGLSTKQIAKQLQRSPATVKAHIQAVLTKYHVHRRSEAAALFRNSQDAKKLPTDTLSRRKDYTSY
jgi:DNA-binding NarL/FixJ family response regulator